MLWSLIKPYFCKNKSYFIISFLLMEGLHGKKPVIRDGKDRREGEKYAEK